MKEVVFLAGLVACVPAYMLMGLGGIGIAALVTFLLLWALS